MIIKDDDLMCIDGDVNRIIFILPDVSDIPPYFMTLNDVTSNLRKNGSIVAIGLGSQFYIYLNSKFNFAKYVSFDEFMKIKRNSKIDSLI